MDDIWIVSANAGRARIFSQAQPGEPLKEINDMANPAVRLRTIDTETDKIGPTAATKSIHNVGGPTPNKTYQPNQTPDEHQSELFARSIAGFLLKSQQEGGYRQLVLAASPEFLGTLRKLLDQNVAGAIRLEVNKDYTQFSGPQLLEKIREHSAKE